MYYPLLFYYEDEVVLFTLNLYIPSRILKKCISKWHCKISKKSFEFSEHSLADILQTASNNGLWNCFFLIILLIFAQSFAVSIELTCNNHSDLHKSVSCLDKTVTWKILQKLENCIRGKGTFPGLSLFRCGTRTTFTIGVTGKYVIIWTAPRKLI